MDREWTGSFYPVQPKMQIDAGLISQEVAIDRSSCAHSPVSIWSRTAQYHWPLELPLSWLPGFRFLVLGYWPPWIVFGHQRTDFRFLACGIRAWPRWRFHLACIRLVLTSSSATFLWRTTALNSTSNHRRRGVRDIPSSPRRSTSAMCFFVLLL